MQMLKTGKAIGDQWMGILCVLRASVVRTAVEKAVDKALSTLRIDSVTNYPLLAGIGASLLDFRRAATNTIPNNSTITPTAR